MDELKRVFGSAEGEKLLKGILGESDSNNDGKVCCLRNQPRYPTRNSCK